MLLQIDAFSDGKFSASGREGAQVAPNGKVYYKNEDVNLKVSTWISLSFFIGYFRLPFAGLVPGGPLQDAQIVQQ